MLMVAEAERRLREAQANRDRASQEVSRLEGQKAQLEKGLSDLISQFKTKYGVSSHPEVVALIEKKKAELAQILARIEGGLSGVPVS